MSDDSPGTIPCPWCGGTGVLPAPPEVTYDDTPITSRSPKLYLKLEETEGAPADSAEAGYAGEIKINGSPTYGVATSKGNGIRLGGDSYIEIPHDPVFTTDGADRPNRIVESEVTFSIHCQFPSTLGNNWVIFSKSDNDSDFSPGVSLRVHKSGSVELRVREHKYRTDVSVSTPAGVVAEGSEHHFTVSLGHQGAWFTVDGRQGGGGFKSTLAWWGLDHRHNGIEEGKQAFSARVTNASSIRLGRTGDQTSSADIVVTKFAVFYAGITRTNFGQKTLGLDLADVQDLAGSSGEPWPEPRFSKISLSPAPGTDVIQAAINACTPNGTVNLSGAYRQASDLVLKKGVRITGNATIVFEGSAKLTCAMPTAMPVLSGGGDLLSGAQSYKIDNTATKDGVFLVIDKTPMQSLFKVDGIHNEYVKKSDMIPISSRDSESITFSRAPFFTYKAANRLSTVWYAPTTDVAIDGNIKIMRSGGTEANILATFHALRRARFQGVTIEQSGSTPNLLAAVFYGCVEVQLNGCRITTTSPQGSDTARHPYALKFAACANYDVFKHTGHSNDWHALDNEADNVDDTWNMPKVIPNAHFSGQFGDIRNSVMSTKNNNFPCICHTSNCIRMQDLYFSSGGGTSIDGYGHNVEGILAAAGGRKTQIAHTRGVGGTRIWHCTFNNDLGNWGNGKFGMTKCSCGNLHYKNPVQTSTFGAVPGDQTNEFVNVDKALRGYPV